MIDVLNVFRQNEYVIDSLELRVTHRKLRTDAGIIARVLLRFGIKAGDIIAVSMPNLYQAVAVFKAANKIGAVTTFLNPLSTREELIQYIEMYHSKVLFNYDKSREYDEKIIKHGA